MRPATASGRSAAYTFAVDISAAKTMVQAKMAAPAYLDDANNLRRRGVFCRAHFSLSESAVEAIESAEAIDAQPEAEIAVEGESGDLVGIVEAAIDSGLKADLVAALELVGIDPDTCSNNAERGEALGAWLEEQGE